MIAALRRRSTLLGILVLLASVGGLLGGGYVLWCKLEVMRCRQLIARARERGWFDPRPDLPAPDDPGNGASRLLDLGKSLSQKIALTTGQRDRLIDMVRQGKLDDAYEALAARYLQPLTSLRSSIHDCLSSPSLVYELRLSPPSWGADLSEWLTHLEDIQNLILIEAGLAHARGDDDAYWMAVEDLLRLRQAHASISSLQEMLYLLRLDDGLFRFLEKTHGTLGPEHAAEVAAALRGPPPVPFAAAMEGEFALVAVWIERYLDTGEGDDPWLPSNRLVRLIRYRAMLERQETVAELALEVSRGDSKALPRPTGVPKVVAQQYEASWVLLQNLRKQRDHLLGVLREK